MISTPLPGSHSGCCDTKKKIGLKSIFASHSKVVAGVFADVRSVNDTPGVECSYIY